MDLVLLVYAETGDRVLCSTSAECRICERAVMGGVRGLVPEARFLLRCSPRMLMRIFTISAQVLFAIIESV